ncbi:MAG TPA: hypothetical protein VID29_09445 [Solirubrobacteraceae bacterium]
MSLREIGLLLRRRAPTALFVFLVTLGAGVALAATHTKRYQSQAKIVLTPLLGKQLTIIPAQDSLQALINGYAETAQSSSTADAMQAALGRPLNGTVSAFTEAGDNSVTIQVEARTPAVAQQDTAALLRVFQASIKGDQLFTATLISPPTLPTQPVQPRPPLIIGSALALGAILSVLLAALVDYIRRPVALAAMADASSSG